MFALKIPETTIPKNDITKQNPEIIQKFTNAIYKGMLWVQEHSSEEIAKVIKSSLEELASDEFGWDNVPGVAEKECGNYRNHSLFGAKEWSKKILSEGISTDPYERKVI